MARRLYLQAAAAPFKPTAVNGTWNNTANIGDVGNLGTGPAGNASTIFQTVATATNPFDILVSTFTQRVSEQLIGGTVQWEIGWVVTGTTPTLNVKVHIWITQGATSNARGVLLSNFVGTDTFNTTAQGRGEGLKNLSSVYARAGDFLVVEIGFSKSGTSSTSVTATHNYGNTGNPDLTEGDTNVTTNPGWIEFSQNFIDASSIPFFNKLRPAIFKPG